MKNFVFVFIFFTFLITSSFAGVAVFGSLTRQRTAEPGETYKGSILLENTGANFCKVTIHKNDYLFYADGKNIYGKPGNDPRSNAKWISLSPTIVTIPPKNSVSVYYTVQVPEYSNLKGSYWSMIMVEPTIEKIKKGKGLSIQTLLRYAVQIITNIGETGVSKIEFMDKKLIQKGKKRTLQLDIRNTGERALSPFVWVQLYNKSGLDMGRFKGRQLRIYPDCSVRHKIDLTNVPKGKYKTLVIADNGDENIFGARYDLRIR